MWSELSCPANQHPKSTIKKKSPRTFAHLVNSSQNVSFMFDNHTILLFWLQKTVRLLSLRDLRFLFCSRDLDALYAQMIMGFFSLITHNYPQGRKMRSHGWFCTIISWSDNWHHKYFQQTVPTLINAASSARSVFRSNSPTLWTSHKGRTNLLNTLQSTIFPYRKSFTINAYHKRIATHIYWKINC